MGERFIPQQLQNSTFRFLKLRKKGKEPTADMVNWQEKNFEYNDTELLNHLIAEENYAIIGGFGNLILIDSDSEEINNLCKRLPETFTVKTGSPEEYKKHYYFIADEKVKPIRLSKENVGDLGDIRSVGQYVVAPTSIHPSGNEYKVIKDIPIAKISEKFVRSIFKDYIDPTESIEFKEFPIETKKRSSDFIRNCLVPDYTINNKIKGGTSKNWKLFPYLVDILHNREVTQSVYVALCKKQGHSISAIKGWVKKAHEGKLAKTSCEKMQDYLNRFHPRLINDICGKCPLSKKEEKQEKKLSKEEIVLIVKEVYHKIVDVLKKYMDLEEENYSLIAIWILGTHFHKEFSTYPYLFFNAMKSSGKSRLINIIKTLSKDGKMLNSITEAVLFRTKGTLCIDEFESIGRVGRENLRELLNSAYKRGVKVIRFRKVKGLDGENQEEEEFNVYRPIVMANIWGMENVLADRCIKIILEKSNNITITKLIEDFEENDKIQNILTLLKQIPFETYTTDTYTMLFEYTKKEWNSYILENQQQLLDNQQQVSVVYSVNSVSSVSSNSNILFDKINNSKLSGRDLELFFPLFLMADICGNLDEILEISQKIVKERKEGDLEENKDIQFIEFISSCIDTDFISVTKLTNQFKESIGSEDKWINASWTGRALRRLALVKEKQNTGRVRQVKLNIKKAQEKIRMFK